MLISDLKYGQRFSLKGVDGVFIRVRKKSIGNVAYVKETVMDLFYCADMEILRTVS